MSHWRWLIVWLCASVVAADEWRATPVIDVPEPDQWLSQDAEERRAILSPALAAPAESAAADAPSATDDTTPETSPAEAPSPPSETPAPNPTAPGIVFEDASQIWIRQSVADEGLIWRELRGSSEILPGDAATFGMTTLGFSDVVSFNDDALPWLYKSESGPGLWCAPRFGWHFLNGPRSPDLPAQLYTLNLELGFVAPIDSATTVHLLVTPSWTTDFHTSGGEAFRVIAGGLVTWRASSEWLLAAGALYLDRPDLPVLPLGGVRWSPSDRFELDLMVPRPRASFRLSEDTESHKSSWLYVGGDLGGGSWAFERPGGFDDRMGYRDLRLVAGVEWREANGARAAFEAGYVFDRRLEFDRGPGSQDLPGTAVIRLGANY